MYLFLTGLVSNLATVPIPLPVQLSYLAGSFNWLCLAGVFTGYRLVEYGQGKIAKAQRYNVAPPLLDAVNWVGSSLAFI
jgi:hypothetical protein